MWNYATQGYTVPEGAISGQEAASTYKYAGSDPSAWRDPTKSDPNNKLAGINSITGIPMMPGRPASTSPGGDGGGDNIDPGEAPYIVTGNGTIKQLSGDAASGYTFRDNYNDPSGKSEKDQLGVTYSYDPKTGTATPTNAEHYYQPSDWVDKYRDLATYAAMVGAAGVGGAYLGASGAAGGGAAAEAGAGAGAALGGGAVEAGATGAGALAGVEGGAATAGLGGAAGAAATTLPTMTITGSAAAGAGGIGASDLLAAGAVAAGGAGAVAGGTTAGGNPTMINSGLDINGFGSGLGSATTGVGSSGISDLAIPTFGSSSLANASAGLAAAGSSGAGSWMQDAVKAATSTAGKKLIGAGLTAALAGGAAGAVAGGSSGSTGATGSQADVGAMQTALAQQQLDFNKTAYAAGQPTRDAATAGALQAQTGQLATQGQQNAIAQKYANEDATTFAPLRQQIVSDAQGYDTAGRRADAMAGARSDVEQAYASSNEANNRAMLAKGVVPGSGRMQSLLADQAIAKANSIAGATTGAVRNVENTGATRMAAAAQLGAFLPAAQTAAANSGTSAGTAATGAGVNAVASQGSGIATMNQGFAGASAANNSAGNLYGQAAGQKATADAAYDATLGKLGGAVGDYLGSTAGQENVNKFVNWLSDEDVKKNTGKPGNRMQALAQINATPVKTGWSYDPDKGGPDDAGAKHTGAMAQAVRRTMGEAVAPGGREISPMDLSGKMMLAVQALSAKVDKLEKSRRAA